MDKLKILKILEYFIVIIGIIIVGLYISGLILPNFYFSDFYLSTGIFFIIIGSFFLIYHYIELERRKEE